MNIVALLAHFGIFHDDKRVPGRSGSFSPVGVIVHHTATAGPALAVCQKGRADLPGPLCHINLTRNGLAHVVSDGRANHAGKGSGEVLARVRSDMAPRGDAAKVGLADDTDGNRWFYGIEVDNDGRGQLYPAVQLEALAEVCAALCRHHGWTANRVIHHREWTRRKVDMSYRGDLRGAVARLLAPPATQPDHDEEEEVKPYLVKKPGGAVLCVHPDAMFWVNEPALSGFVAKFGQPADIDDATFEAMKKALNDPGGQGA